MKTAPRLRKVSDHNAAMLRSYGSLHPDTKMYRVGECIVGFRFKVDIQPENAAGIAAGAFRVLEIFRPDRFPLIDEVHRAIGVLFASDQVCLHVVDPHKQLKKGKLKYRLSLLQLIQAEEATDGK